MQFMFKLLQGPMHRNAFYYVLEGCIFSWNFCQQLMKGLSDFCLPKHNVFFMVKLCKAIFISRYFFALRMYFLCSQSWSDYYVLCDFFGASGGCIIMVRMCKVLFIWMLFYTCRAYLFRFTWSNYTAGLSIFFYLDRMYLSLLGCSYVPFFTSWVMLTPIQLVHAQLLHLYI